MTVSRWNELTDSVGKFQEVFSPLELLKKAVGVADNNIQNLVYGVAKPVEAYLAMTALRALPMTVADLHYPLLAHGIGAVIAIHLAYQDQTPTSGLTPTIKTAHALALAFFINLVIDVFQQPANILSTKTLLDSTMLAAFLFLGNNIEAIASQGKTL